MTKLTGAVWLAVALLAACGKSHDTQQNLEAISSAPSTVSTSASGAGRSAAPTAARNAASAGTSGASAAATATKKKAPSSMAVHAPPSGTTGNWVGFGGGLNQTFAGTDSPITKSKLSEIGSAWERTAPGGVTGTPATYDDVVYWTDWVGNVHADKVSDGSEVWTKSYDRGFTSSPFVTEDKLFLSNRDNMVYALDRKTGKELWATAVSDDPLTQLWSSPTAVDGIVIVGIGGKGTSDAFVPFTSDMLMSFRGGVIGLDADSGKVHWKFENTVDDQGKQWGPGVSSWSTAAVDTKRKIAYIGAGNSYYAPASPYSDSLLALDYMTSNPKGHLVWHHQFTMDDNFTSASPMGPDSDVGATPNLFTLEGKDYVTVGDKGGHFYELDRESGELIWSVPVGRGSGIGGVLAPASYADGKLYVMANDLSATDVYCINAKDGEVDWMTSLTTGVSFGAPLLLNDVFLVGTSSFAPAGPPSDASIIALDRDTGDQVQNWTLPIKNQRGGGMSVYQNTLLVGYGFVFENTAAESMLAGGMLAAALGGKPITAPAEPEKTATHDPKYGAIYDEVFTKQGCTVDRCHGGLGIKLETKDAGYKSLTNDSGTMSCAGMKFVVPGKPDDSLLYRKLADEKPPCGARMPLGLSPLKPEELMQLRYWIEKGAHDD